MIPKGFIVLEKSQRSESTGDFQIIALQRHRRKRKHGKKNARILGGKGTLAFHHFQPGIKLMAARYASDTVGFDYRFVIPDAHTATIRTAR